MYQIVPVASMPGVQRDGRHLAAKAYTDAQWCRWQRGLPRKMGGYKNTQAYLTAVSRALFSQAGTGYRYLNSGNYAGVDQWTVDPVGISSAVRNLTFPGTTNPTTTGLPTAPVGVNPASQVNSWQFDTQFDNLTGLNLLFMHANQNLLDPSNTGNFPLYAVSVYNQGSAVVQVPGFATGPDGHGGTLQALFPNGISGGVCSLAPYLTIYGNDGFLAWSAPGFPTDFTGFSQGSGFVGATRITNQKIVKGLPLRGGGGFSPNGLYWSIDSVIRGTFIGVPNGTFQFDQLTTQSSILSDRCIIENDGTFYWVGVDRFLMYNGVIQEIPNTMNINWFFDNINQRYAGKSFAMKIPRYGEIWWCYPRGQNTECSHAVIYNYREKCWYDTALPPDMRSSGIYGDALVNTIMCSPTPSATTSIALTAVATSIAGTAVYTGTIKGGAGNALFGQTYNITGFTTAANNGRFMVSASDDSTLTLSNAAAVSETHAAVATTPQNFGAWLHEQGTDKIQGTSINAIQSSFTTAPWSALTSDPASDKSVSVGVMQQDFIQSGDMTVTVLKKSNPQQGEYNGSVATIQANPLATATVQEQQIGFTTPLKDTAKIIRLRFESNVVGGNYQMGHPVIEVGTDGTRDT